MKGEPGLSDLSALGGKQQHASADSNSDDFQNYFDEVKQLPEFKKLIYKSHQHA